MPELAISVKIPPVNEEKTTRAFKNYRRRNLERSNEILLEQVHQELVNRSMIVFGDLDESFGILELTETSDYSRVRVGSDDIAAAVAERGANEADGGIVNVREILAWVQQKPIFPTRGTQEQFAFAIARAIGERGQPLSGGIKRPFHNAQKRAKRRIDKLWNDDLQQLVKDLSTK